MLITLELLLLLCAAVAALPNLTLAAQILASFLPPAARHPVPKRIARASRLAILIPAHNEAAGLAATIANAKRQLEPGDRIVVVADNCTDQTATIADSCGAETVVRHDLTRRGKGYALDAGYGYLRDTSNQPDIVVILDADCRLEANALAVLRETCARTGRPAQAVYLMKQRPGNSQLGARIAEFAWRVKNLVRPLGQLRLGQPCPLMGSGMAFPFALLGSVPLATGHIVEDLVLGTELALIGRAPVLSPGAIVTSEFPESDAARETQKTRWVHGFIVSMRDYAPKLLIAGLQKRDSDALALGADLLVPPLTILIAIDAALFVVTGTFYLATGEVWPFKVSAIASLCAGFSLFIAWLAHGRDLLHISDVFALSAHVAMMRRIAGKLVSGRRSEWVRTERTPE